MSFRALDFEGGDFALWMPMAPSPPVGNRFCTLRVNIPRAFGRDAARNVEFNRAD